MERLIALACIACTPTAVVAPPDDPPIPPPEYAPRPDAAANVTDAVANVPPAEAGQLNGRLPPEVIQRTVRQHFGRFRVCYEKGLAGNARLQGRVAIKFVIGLDGRVTEATDGGSDLPDPDVIECCAQGFRDLRFDAPEGGIVTVVYPIVFNPGP